MRINNLKKIVFLLALLLNILPALKNGELDIESTNVIKAQNAGSELVVEVCGWSEFGEAQLDQNTCIITKKRYFYSGPVCRGSNGHLVETKEIVTIDQTCLDNKGGGTTDPGTGGTGTTDPGTGGTGTTDPGTGGSSSGGTTTPSNAKSTINIVNKSQWKQQAPSQCCKACGDYLTRTGLDNVGSRQCVFRLTYQDNSGSHPYGNATNSLNTVVNVINRHLEEGRGITVGLDYRPNSSNADGTDHFVTITGRGYDTTNGKNYYTYMDPGRGNADLGTSTTANRLYIDDTTIHGTRQGKDNTLTHIRPNDGNCNGSTTY